LAKCGAIFKKIISFERFPMKVITACKNKSPELMIL
jgi:hypothetical protein